jgi:hypothetical protein
MLHRRPPIPYMNFVAAAAVLHRRPPIPCMNFAAAAAAVQLLLKKSPSR